MGVRAVAHVNGVAVRLAVGACRRLAPGSGQIGTVVRSPILVCDLAVMHVRDLRLDPVGAEAEQQHRS